MKERDKERKADDLKILLAFSSSLSVCVGVGVDFTL